MPKMRTYRLTSARPDRAIKYGSTDAVNIGSSSQGGPGRWITTFPSPIGTIAPGAVPFGFISSVESAVNIACERLLRVMLR